MSNFIKVDILIIEYADFVDIILLHFPEAIVVVHLLLHRLLLGSYHSFFLLSKLLILT